MAPQMYDITCCTCGEPGKVPFKPEGEGGLQCRPCWEKENKPQLEQKIDNDDGSMDLIFSDGSVSNLNPEQAAVRKEMDAKMVSKEEYLAAHPEIAAEREARKQKEWVRLKIPTNQANVLRKHHRKFDPDTEEYSEDGAVTRGVKAAVMEYTQAHDPPDDPDMEEALHILQGAPPEGVPYVDLVRLLGETLNCDTTECQRRIQGLFKDGWIQRDKDKMIVNDRRINPLVNLLKMMG